MTEHKGDCPCFMAIFNRMVEGDDALLELAAARFSEAGLGAELHPSDVGNFIFLRSFLSSQTPSTIHLPRNLDLADFSVYEQICDYSALGSERLRGMVIHDSHALNDSFSMIFPRLSELDRSLNNFLYIEYAAGLGFESFYQIASSLASFSNIGICIDISHIAIQACRIEFSRLQPHIDICALKPHDPAFARYLDDIELAVNNAREFVFPYLERLCRLAIPLHFHLHDGHPASVYSRFGVCDHLSFLWNISLPFEHNGRRCIENFYGIKGLERIAGIINNCCDLSRVNLMFEIHPQDGTLALGEHCKLFENWQDLHNAQKMNFWLEILINNACLLRYFVSNK